MARALSARRLLHIEASPRRERSRSSAVAADLIAGLGDIEVERLALFEADLPPFDGAAIEARYALIGGESVPPGAQASWRRVEAAIAHFLSFDLWLFSVPMWNFGIPWRLKQYVDLITQPGLAFAVGPDGQVEGKAHGTAILVAAGALDTRPDGALAGLDFQVAYLSAWLGFIGVSDVRTVRVQPTYGSEAEVEGAMARARAEARAVAAALRA